MFLMVAKSGSPVLTMPGGFLCSTTDVSGESFFSGGKPRWAVVGCAVVLSATSYSVTEVIDMRRVRQLGHVLSMPILCLPLSEHFALSG